MWINWTGTQLNHSVLIKWCIIAKTSVNALLLHVINYKMCPHKTCNCKRYPLFTTDERVHNEYTRRKQTNPLFYLYFKCALKLYCGYKYTMLCMINRIWSLKQQVINDRWIVMLDFICIGSAELFRTGWERTILNKNICLQRDLNPRPGFHER